MSATTKSLILLAALGVAACDSSSNPVTTPTAPTETEAATATRAAEFPATTEADATAATDFSGEEVYSVSGLGDIITLADGTELQTAGAAVYTRFGAEDADPEAVLTPTATFIASYEFDEDGNPTSIAFYEAGGIGFEGLPVGAVAATGFGGSVAFMKLNDLDGVALFGEAVLTLDFDDVTGTFETPEGMYGSIGDEMAGSYGYLDIFADLDFDPQTGIFTSTDGTAYAEYSQPDVNAYLETSLVNVALSGELQGIAEAFSGEFTVDGSGFDVVGGFVGAIDQVTTGQP